MIINREKIYDVLVQAGLKYLINLKLSFLDCSDMMKLLMEINCISNCFMKPLRIQVVLYGGNMIRGAVVPPFYEFSVPEEQTAFEAVFIPYITGNEDLTEFSIINVEISAADYSALPEDLETDLSGIVNLIVV